MRTRLLAVLALAVLVSGACTYESSGTTTTTIVVDASDLPDTGPAAVVFTDQRIEGSAVVVDSVTLPGNGFVVLQADDGGGPGEVIGISDPLGGGTTVNVPIAFFLPIEGDTVVHATAHVDMDGNGRFTYEPPDEFVDLPATRQDGEVARVSALATLLPPLTPGAVVFEEQRVDGTSLAIAGVTLPAPGFVAVQRNEAGEPGAVLGVSDLLPAGDTGGLVIELDPPLRVTGLVFVVAYVDRDEDGELAGIGLAGGDEPAVSGAGDPAIASQVVAVVPLDPASVSVEDQEGDGTVVTIAEVVLPSPGFVLLFADDLGTPGEEIARSEWINQSSVTDLEFELDEPLAEDTTLRVAVWIDFDEDRELGDADRRARDTDGSEVEGLADYTFVPPDDDDEDGEAGDGDQ
jgi:hypothetical protein